MATVGQLVVKIGADVSDLDQKIRGTQDKLRSAGSAMMSLGAGLSGTVTAPLLGLGAAAMAAGEKLNEGMANVQSLGVAQDRIESLKGSVQETAILVGKSTEDMAAGLYQAESAFGDTADIGKKLEINAKAAAGGLATVTDSINLTSAVTKGYGDTSATAVQHVADLALKTVALGQTTFPELAGSIGTVTPLASNLGVKMEELFGVMATATGVTGGASEVSTQLRGVLQSLMAPTDSMADLMHSMGFASGEAMLKGKGLQGTISAIITAARKSGQPLQKYIGSVEGQTLALALAGPQAEAFTQKLAEMQNAAGATDAAFEAQTQGVDKNGFALQQAKVKLEVFLQKLYDGMGPALLAVTGLIAPFVDKLLALGDIFAKMTPTQQLWIVGLLGAAAALGPLLIILGMVTNAIAAALPALAAIGGAFGLLLSPIGLVAIALGALVYFNFGGIRDFAAGILGRLQAAAPLASDALHELWAQLTGIGIDTYDTTEGIYAFVEALTGSQEMAATVSNKIGDIGYALYEMEQRIATAAPLVSDAFGELLAQLTGIGAESYDTTEGIYAFVEALTGSPAIAQQVADAVWDMGTALASARAWFGTTWAAAQSELLAAWSAMQPQLQQLWGWLQVNIPLALTTVQLWFASVWAAIPGVVSAAWGAISPLLTQLWTWLQVNIPLALTTVQAWFSAAWAAIPGVVSAAWANMGGILTQLWTWLQVTIPLALSVVQAWFTTAWSAAGAAVSGAWNTVGPLLTQLWTWLQVNIPLALTTVQAWFSAAWAAIPGVVSAAWANMGGILTQLWTWLQVTIPLALTTLQAWFGTAWAAIAGATSSAATTMTTVWNQLVAIFGPGIERLIASFGQFGTQLATLGPDFQALWAAAQPVIMALGAAVGVVLVFAVNLLANTFNNLVPIIRAAINQAATILNTLVTTVQGAIALVAALINGDWAGAWNAARGIVSGLATFVQSSLNNLWIVVSTVFAVIAATIRDTLADLGFTGAAAAVQMVIDKVSALSGWLTRIGSGDVKIGVPTWVTNLLAWAWPAAPDEIASIQKWGWPAVPGVIADLIKWAWPDAPAVISDLIKWAWPAVPKLISELLDWGWPGAPDWINNLMNWQPAVPGWVSKLLGWAGIDTAVPAHALGTQYSREGVAIVGENGPEPVWLPGGSRVMSNTDFRSALAGAGGPTVQLTGDVHIHNDLDVEELMWRIAQKFKRNG